MKRKFALAGLAASVFLVAGIPSAESQDSATLAIVEVVSSMVTVVSHCGTLSFWCRVTESSRWDKLARSRFRTEHRS